MTRVSSQATRQAILVEESSFDPEHPPDNLALFGTDGTLLNAESLKGADGVAGPPGIPGINWRGLYSPGADYIVNDGVYYNGSSWRALLPMLHPAAVPSEDSPLATIPFGGGGDWPTISVGGDNEVLVPDYHTEQYRYLDILSPGTIHVTWTTDTQLFVAVYDNTQSASYGSGTAPFSHAIPAGRYWILIQDATAYESPNMVHITVTLTDGATASATLPWVLVAKGGDPIEGGAYVTTASADPQTINKAVGVTSISRTAAGTYHVTVDTEAVDAYSLWPSARVVDATTEPWHCQCVPVSTTEFDVYVFSAAGDLTDGHALIIEFKARTE